jgi:hypothetical protein
MQTNQITYKKACKSCDTQTGRTHMVLWEDSSELFKNGDLIEEEDLFKLLVEFHFDQNIACDKCRSKNLWDFWDIKVNDIPPPFGNQPAIQLKVDSEKTVLYNFYEIARIINNANKRLDLRLSQPLKSEKYKEIAIKVTIKEAILLLSTSYEINLIPDRELLVQMLKYFSQYFNVKIDFKDYQRLKSVFNEWESKIIEGFNGESYVVSADKFHKPAVEMFGYITAIKINSKYYGYFLKQYLQTKQLLFFYFNKIAKREGLYADQHMLDYMNKLIPAINRL